MPLTSAFRYETLSGTAGPAYTTVMFTRPSRWMNISVFNSSATIRFILNDGSLGDEVVVDPLTMAFPFPYFLLALGFAIRNTVALNNAGYQIVSNS